MFNTDKTKTPSRFPLDTSVLVKPSQIFPQPDRYVKLLKSLERQGRLNRLGIPVYKRKAHTRDIHAENVADLKNTFRKKQTTMPYKHPELSKLPFEVLEEETKIAFDVNKISKEQRDVYQQMCEEVFSKKYGEPFDIAKHIFDEF